jgi:hypothetical protein
MHVIDGMRSELGRDVYRNVFRAGRAVGGSGRRSRNRQSQRRPGRGYGTGLSSQGFLNRMALADVSAPSASAATAGGMVALSSQRELIDFSARKCC